MTDSAELGTAREAAGVRSTAFTATARFPCPRPATPAIRRGPVLAVPGQVAFMPDAVPAGTEPPGFEEQARRVFSHLLLITAPLQEDETKADDRPVR